VVSAGVINFGGMRLYARTQRLAFLIGLIGLIIMIGIFASSTNNQFIRAFNNFAMAYTSDPDAYHSMITASTQAGFVTSPKTSIVQSFMAVTVMAFGFTGIIWSAENAGEIKNAHSFNSQIFQIVGSLLFGAVLLAILAAVMYPTVGSGFLAATGYLFFTGNSAYPIPIAPYFPLYALILNPNAIGAAFIVLWGVLWIFYPVSNAPLAGSRFLLAASFDRTLPAKFSAVSERFHVPYFALITMTLAMLILGALYVFVPDIGAATADGIFAMMIMEMCTCISAAIFPYRMKEAYKSSVVSKYEIAGIPLMSITGAVSVVFLLWLVYIYATMSELGVNSTLSAIFLLVVFVSGIVAYYVAKAYRKSQGIDINLVFREVPPE